MFNIRILVFSTLVLSFVKRLTLKDQNLWCLLSQAYRLFQKRKKKKKSWSFFDVNTLLNILFHKSIFIKGPDQILALRIHISWNESGLSCMSKLAFLFSHLYLELFCIVVGKLMLNCTFVKRNRYAFFPSFVKRWQLLMEIVAVYEPSQYFFQD